MTGRNVPIFNTPSPARVPSTGTSATSADVRRLRGLEHGLGVFDLVLGVELLDAVAGDRGFTVARELERARDTVVVDVLRAALDELIALLAYVVHFVPLRVT